jgi:hypothetical protein
VKVTTVLIENTRRRYILRAGSLLLKVDAVTEACIEVALEILHIRLDFLQLVLLLLEVITLLLNEALIVLGGSVLIDIDQSLTNEEFEALTERLFDELLGILKGVEVISQLLNISSQVVGAHVQLREHVDLSLVLSGNLGVSLKYS